MNKAILNMQAGMGNNESIEVAYSLKSRQEDIISMSFSHHCPGFPSLLMLVVEIADPFIVQYSSLK